MKKFPFLCKAAETSNWPWPAAPRASCINTPSTPPSADDEIPDQFPDKDEETAVIQGLMSDRLFFEPGKSNSILEEAKVPDGGVAVVELDSRNPVRDFKASMAEMVEAYGLREDWDSLEALLEWYLQVNGEQNHAYIIGAFVDLVLQLESGNINDDDGVNVMMNPAAVDEERAASSASSSNAPCSFTFSSSNYSSTTHCLSVLETEDDDDEGNIIVEHSTLRHGRIHVI